MGFTAIGGGGSGGGGGTVDPVARAATTSLQNLQATNATDQEVVDAKTALEVLIADNTAKVTALETAGTDNATDTELAAEKAALQVSIDANTTALTALNSVTDNATDTELTDVQGILQTAIDVNTAAIAATTNVAADVAANATAIALNVTAIADTAVTVADNTTAIADNVVAIAVNTAAVLAQGTKDTAQDTALADHIAAVGLHLTPALLAVINNPHVIDLIPDNVAHTLTVKYDNSQADKVLDFAALVTDLTVDGVQIDASKQVFTFTTNDTGTATDFVLDLSKFIHEDDIVDTHNAGAGSSTAVMSEKQIIAELKTVDDQLLATGLFKADKLDVTADKHIIELRDKKTDLLISLDLARYGTPSADDKNVAKIGTDGLWFSEGVHLLDTLITAMDILKSGLNLVPNADKSFSMEQGSLFYYDDTDNEIKRLDVATQATVTFDYVLEDGTTEVVGATEIDGSKYNVGTDVFNVTGDNATFQTFYISKLDGSIKGMYGTIEYPNITRARDRFLFESKVISPALTNHILLGGFIIRQDMSAFPANNAARYSQVFASKWGEVQLGGSSASEDEDAAPQSEIIQGTDTAIFDHDVYKTGEVKEFDFRASATNKFITVQNATTIEYLDSSNVSEPVVGAFAVVTPSRLRVERQDGGRIVIKYVNTNLPISFKDKFAVTAETGAAAIKDGPIMGEVIQYQSAVIERADGGFLSSYPLPTDRSEWEIEVWVKTDQPRIHIAWLDLDGSADSFAVFWDFAAGTFTTSAVAPWPNPGSITLIEASDKGSLGYYAKFTITDADVSAAPLFRMGIFATELAPGQTSPFQYNTVFTVAESVFVTTAEIIATPYDYIIPDAEFGTIDIPDFDARLASGQEFYGYRLMVRHQPAGLDQWINPEIYFASNLPNHDKLGVRTYTVGKTIHLRTIGVNLREKAARLLVDWKQP